MSRTIRRQPSRFTVTAVISGLAVVAVAILAYFVAGGGGSDAPPEAGSRFGPTPSLGGNIRAIHPAHADRVRQQDTRSPDPLYPRGICVDVVFDGTPETTAWFQMAVDDQLVTTQLSWILTELEAPEDGTVCYSPEEGLPVGLHTAAIAVVDPTDPHARPRQVVAWAFEVIS